MKNWSIRDIIGCIGFMLLMLGAMCAESESLVIPFLMIIIGGAMMLLTQSDEEDEEAQDEYR